jgi:hypothetical protein
MALIVPNLDRISKESPKLGEALKKVQDYTNTNVTPVAGNRTPPPGNFVNPGRPPG